MTKKTKITMRRALAFRPADGREAVLWDSTVSGFGLQVRSNGRKTWIVHLRRNGSAVKRTLGALDALTVEDARPAARALCFDAETNHAPTPTVRKFARTFLADCAERWKPSTQQNYARTIKRWILRAFGGRRVDTVSARDVRNWHDGIAATHPASANWSLAAMSSLMKHAEAPGLRHADANPCKGLRRRKSGFRAHYLTDAEVGRAGAQVGARARRPCRVAGQQDRPAHDLAGVARPGHPGRADSMRELSLGVRVRERQARLTGHGLEAGPHCGGTGYIAAARRGRTARPCRHRHHVRLCASRGRLRNRRGAPHLAQSFGHARRRGGGP